MLPVLDKISRAWLAAHLCSGAFVGGDSAERSLRPLTRAARPILRLLPTPLVYEVAPIMFG